MQVLNGYVNAVREVTTKFGQRIVMDVVAGHREATVWRPGKDTHLLDIKPGSQAQFTCDSRGKYHLVDNSIQTGAVAVAVAVAPQPAAIEPAAEIKAETVPSSDYVIPDQTKRDIATYVQSLADLYGFCLKTAGNIEGINDNDRRQIATTLFISTREKFNL